MGLQAKAAKPRDAVRAPPGEDAASRSVAAESNHLAGGRPAPEGFMRSSVLAHCPAYGHTFSGPNPIQFPGWSCFLHARHCPPPSSL